MIKKIAIITSIVSYCFLSNTCMLFSEPSQISGNVRDAETGLAIFYVNVFLANTTKGTTTNRAGDFVIRNIPPGDYQLVIHHIGYALEIRSVNTFNSVNIEFDITLTPIAIKGESVEVEAPDARKWRKLLKVFKQQFIGTSNNAKQCEIRNPEVLGLWIDPGTAYLMAATDSVLHIVNHALGYRSEVVLLGFEYDHDKDTVRYQTLPVFEDLLLTNSPSSEKWRKNRRRCFAGSSRHFLMAASRDRTFQEGFTAMQVFTSLETGWFIGRHERNPRWVEGKDLIAMYNGAMYISSEYPLYVRYRTHKSWIELKDGAVRIDTLGNCWGRRAADGEFSVIRRYGHWANERFADFLPFDYRYEKR